MPQADSIVKPEPPRTDSMMDSFIANDQPEVESSQPIEDQFENLDPHTQREIYSTLALPPEPGIGPNSILADSTGHPDRPIETRPKKRRISTANHEPGKQDLTIIRHEARCSICKHPEREAIDQALLHWEPPTRIALEFNLGSRLALYRHARTLGLFEQRSSKTRHCLAQLMEQAGSIVPTAGDVIRAVRAFSCLDENGRWTEPAREVIVTRRVVYESVPPPGPPNPSHQRPALPKRATGASAQAPKASWRNFFSLAAKHPKPGEQQPILIDTLDEQNSGLTLPESVT